MSAEGPSSTSPSIPRVRCMPEEGQLGVRHRVDVRPHQVAPLGAQPQVGAAERDDPRLGRRAAGDREPVRPGARAGDDRPRAGGAARVADRDRVRRRLECADGAAGAPRCRRVRRDRGRRRPRPRRSRRRRSPASAGPRAPAACGSISRDLRRRRCGAGRGPRSRARGARARRAGRARLRRWRRSACRQRSSVDPALVAVLVELARPGDAEPRLQRARARSRCPRG